MKKTLHLRIWIVLWIILTIISFPAQSFAGLPGTSTTKALQLNDDPDGSNDDNIVYAINAGGQAFTSGAGISFSADQQFSGGTKFSTSASIGSTTNDPLYLSERYGDFSYALPVENGSYEITLHFAEIYWTSTGKRVFDVLAEGQDIITDLDIFAKVGKNEAYRVIVKVKVTDGTLNLSFRTDQDNAKLSALLAKTVVDDVNGGSDENIVHAINAGGQAFTSGGGINFNADQHFNGGSKYVTSASIGSTTNDPLYQSERYGNFSYALPVENGSYEITLYFAEIYWTSTGKRVFDVQAEGLEVISDLDIFAKAGKNEAYKAKFTAEVTDGILNLSFLTDINNAKLSALVVRKVVSDVDGGGGENIISAINAGGKAYTSGAGISFSADQQFNGGTKFSTTGSIGSTTNDPLYQSERYGNFSYSIPVENGNYEITFYFAEIYWTTIGKRVFDVQAEGQEIISDLDVFAEVGKNEAFKVKAGVEVRDGVLDLSFLTNQDNAKLSALVVRSSGAPTPQAPAAPSQLSASAVSASQINLSWLDNSDNEANFVIEKAPSAEGTFAELAILNANTTDFSDKTLSAGETAAYRLKAVNSTGSSAYTATVTATTPAPEPEPEPGTLSLSGFTLVNADTDKDIGPLEDGDLLNLSELPTSNLNVRANTSSSDVGSVVFTLNGSVYNTESVAPYALEKDNNGDYNAWTPATGSYKLVATPYTESGGDGTAGSSLSISFEVVNDAGGGDGGGEPGSGNVTVAGELKKWHKISLSFEGPQHSETDNNPNPFLDYRLDVTFTHSSSGKTYTFPGYFAADGNAAESSASSGNIWRVHFRPDETGEWTYKASFRTGQEVAVSNDPTAGTAVSTINGSSGTLNISPSDKTGDDFRAKGLLKYVGKHYLQFAETGEYFVKGGPDSPENLLSYEDFDNTPDLNGYQKSYSPHRQDWNTGDPSWQGGKGSELIGALNYLASEELNAISFLSMNINGDDKSVYPHVSPSDLLHFDISKMEQWEIVFEHAQRLGLQMLFKTQETENDQLLDGGQLGVQRKLYYRMLIAHYGHHLALSWNLGEENDIWTELNDPDNKLLKSYADYINKTDPFQHHIVVHTYPGQEDEVYGPLLGNQSLLTGASLQTTYTPYNAVSYWRQQSANAGKPWVIASDEIGSGAMGTPPDIGYTDPQTGETYDGSGVSITQDALRKNGLWGTLMAGGAGVNLYFGYKLPQNDLNLQDFRSRDKMWDYVRHALSFWMSYVPFEEMDPNNSLVTNGWAFAKEGEVYVIYLANGGSTDIKLGSSGSNYTVSWYNPRTGGSLQQGSISSVTASGQVSVGTPPGDSNQDWVVLLRNKSITSQTMARMGSGNNMDPEVLSGVKYYPVPFREQLSIQFDERKQHVEVRIISISGSTVYNESAVDIQELSIDTQNLSRGLYAIRIRADGVNISRKILKVD